MTEDISSSNPSLLSRRTIFVFGVAAALGVGNVYLVQTILDLTGRTFAMSPASLGLTVTLTQLGYAAGLLVLVPLSDVIDRRWLIVGQTLLSALALTAVAFASTLSTFLTAIALVGFLAVVVQTLVAYAAALAPDHSRGRVVGSVTSGVVIGILGARFLGGAISDLFGWRMVYAGAAVALFLMTIVLHRALPPDPRRETKLSYRATLAKLPKIFIGDRVLLVRALFAMVAFTAFSAFWTALVLPLSASPYSLSHTAIGLFGIVGIAGALGARSAGAWADRGRQQLVTGASLVLLCLSWAMMAMMPWSLWWLIVGMLMLDFAVQAIHVTNQTLIVTRHPEASGSVIAGYMIFYSLGSALGAAVSTYGYSLYGWNGVCAVGESVSFAGLVFWISTRHVRSLA